MCVCVGYSLVGTLSTHGGYALRHTRRCRRPTFRAVRLINQCTARSCVRCACQPTAHLHAASIEQARAETAQAVLAAVAGASASSPPPFLGARASVHACPGACLRARARGCVCASASACVCVCVCVCVGACVSECASMPESMRARVLERTLPPNRPPATSCVACCTGHVPLQPLAARRRLAQRRGVCGFVR